jgi:hypothetical protein
MKDKRSAYDNVRSDGNMRSGQDETESTSQP